MEKHSLGARRQRQARGGRFSGAALITFATLFAHGAAAASHATPYWIAWEGDDWPENQGWTRDILGGGDVRTLGNGVMTLDGLNTGPGFVWDAYEWFRPGNMDPGPGETFVMQWRMRVDALAGGNWDPAVYLFSDEAWALELRFSMGRIWSVYENVLVPFAAGSFHDYEVRSHDMRTYELLIDASVARVGMFVHNIPPGSWLGWGDSTGDKSLSVWDYFRFGVALPEPASAGVLVLGVIAARVRRMR